MNIGPKFTTAVAGAFLAALPALGFAQSAAFSGEIAATLDVCAVTQGAGEQRPSCLQSLLPLLSELRAQTSGAQYDTEIAALALAIVTAYRTLSSPTPQICGTLADAMDETGRAAVDEGQAAQIFAIAVSIRACAGLDVELGRLLASPN